LGWQRMADHLLTFSHIPRSECTGEEALSFHVSSSDRRIIATDRSGLPCGRPTADRQ
jgi:hypothetical protein